MTSKNDIKLWVLDLDDDDPKKCSAKKLVRFEMARTVSSIYRFPVNTILLDPFADRAVSPSDREYVSRKGIGIIDCSWVNAEKIFSKSFIRT